MKMHRIFGCWVLFVFLGITAARGQGEKIPTVTEGDFRKVAVLFLEYPDGDKAAEMAKVILAFAADTPRAEVLLDTHVMKWTGKERKYGLMLLAGYLVGNTQAQLDSGVKRDDAYSGLLKMFHVHLFLKKRHADYTNEPVEELLRLHRDGRLITHLEELQKARLMEMEKAKKKVKEKSA
jgi:hypothetical protein